MSGHKVDDIVRGPPRLKFVADPVFLDSNWSLNEVLVVSKTDNVTYTMHKVHFCVAGFDIQMKSLFLEASTL
jgi:hypothetical protein